MASFESGVASYITGRAVIEVHFPVDFKGNADISCRQCPYFRASYSTCGLNGQVVAYPTKFVGDGCPLEAAEEKEGHHE